MLGAGRRLYTERDGRHERQHEVYVGTDLPALGASPALPLIQWTDEEFMGVQPKPAAQGAFVNPHKALPPVPPGAAKAIGAVGVNKLKPALPTPPAAKAPAPTAAPAAAKK